MPSPFVANVDVLLVPKLKKDLEEQGFQISQPPHTFFSGKKKGVSCTLYESGKLVVQGKEAKEFIEFYLEPEILKDFSFSHPDLELDFRGRIGVDEAGKGDFFGPLCVAGVFAEGEGIKRLQHLGVKDSKGMTDKGVIELGSAIEKEFPHEIVRIGPKKYNDLYSKFLNLNHLLAWGHATVIEELVNQTGCKFARIDQFATESVVENALQRKGLKIELHQRHRGEEDLVVAAASILARRAFLISLQKLTEKFGLPMPKGASKQVIQAGKTFLEKYGEEKIREVGKLHFKTLDSIIH